MTSQLSALDGTDNFNYLMALQDICSRIDSGSDSRRNSVAANSNIFSPFSPFTSIYCNTRYKPILECVEIVLDPFKSVWTSQEMTLHYVLILAL